MGGAGRGGPSQGEGVGVCEPPSARSAEAFEDILYLVYEASWFHVHHTAIVQSQLCSKYQL